MGRPYAWGRYDEEGLRFALLVAHHELRELAVRLATERERQGRALGEAQRIRAQYHDAYRDLTGALHAVRDDELDREPAPEQWPVREAVRHMLGALYGFSGVVQLAVEAHERGEPQAEPSAEELARAKAQPVPFRELASGDREAVADALFAAHQRAMRAMSLVRDDLLERPALFWDGEMPLRFRLHRFEAHLRQHTVQIDKTMLALGHPPTEAERLVRLLHGALAGVESAQLGGWTDDALLGASERRIAALVDAFATA